MNEFIERPWGGYQIIYENFGIVVKILSVNPGARLSLQKHTFRSEEWTSTTSGMVAEIGPLLIDLDVHSSVYVAAGEIHRLHNTSDEVGHVVEVITGLYDEEDIIRLEDDYGRIESEND